MKKRLSRDEYLKGILSLDHNILSKAITLLESKLSEDQLLSNQIIKELGVPEKYALKIGISGIPGAGKSTFIEGLGKEITKEGKKVAVLTIDPSSTISKGSILGDKTRMETLAVDPLAFIRTSPSASFLGGATPYTRNLLKICEAAGFDVIIVETVGAGQSEVQVQSMTDYFLLLLIAGAGDDLQAIKRGILELADFIIINKADGENIPKAELFRRQLKTTLETISLDKSKIPEIHGFSSLDPQGFAMLWKKIISRYDLDFKSGIFLKKRVQQLNASFEETLKNKLLRSFFEEPSIQKSLLDKIEDLTKGITTLEDATDELIKKYKKTH